MNKRTHIILGRLLYEQLYSDFGIGLDKESFLLGNILPDLQLTFIVRPHSIDNCLQILRDEIDNLIRIKQDSAYCGKYYSRRLGVICHYCADFFCFPHSRYYKGDIPAHVRYEKAMYLRLRRKPGVTVRPPCSAYHGGDGHEEDMMACLDRAQNAYFKAVPSFETDIYYSLQVCLDIMLMITRTSMAVILPETEDLNPPPLFT